LLGQEFYQGGIGATFDRWRGDPDLESISDQAGKGSAPATRTQAQLADQYLIAPAQGMLDVQVSTAGMRIAINRA